MKDLLTLATATLLCTATAAYAGEAVGEDFAIADTKLAAKPASFKASTRLAALDARMAEHKLAEFKETGVKPAADALAMDGAPKPETPKDGEPLPALMASTETLDAEEYYYDAIAKNDKALTDKQVDVAAYDEGFLLATWQGEPGMEEPTGDFDIALSPVDPKTAKPEAFAEKELSTPIVSPFGVTSNSEIAALEASGAEPMGGPLDPAEFLAEGWSTHDADADGGLTP
ncbi:MAG: hypothetical protein H7X93_12695, partial [Sphingomonadaceae bacterium]|nr:hypothetical protein [Sphingomonadaceae bacterium]